MPHGRWAPGDAAPGGSPRGTWTAEQQEAAGAGPGVVRISIGTEDADDLIAFFEVTQRLLAEERLLAYHDRSDGGLFTTLAEMAFAGRTGVDIVLDNIAGDGPEAVAALFAEAKQKKGSRL